MGDEFFIFIEFTERVFDVLVFSKLELNFGGTFLYLSFCCK